MLLTVPRLQPASKEGVLDSEARSGKSMNKGAVQEAAATGC